MLVGKKRQMVCPAAPHVTMVRAIRQTDASYTQTMKIPCAGHAPAMHEMINEFPRLLRVRKVNICCWQEKQTVCPATPHVPMVRTIRQTVASYTQTMQIPCAGHAPAMHETINEFPRLLRVRKVNIGCW